VCDSDVYSGSTTNVTVHASKYMPLMGKKNITLASYLQPQENSKLEPNSEKAQGITS
jgi:hypothetical protein